MASLLKRFRHLSGFSSSGPHIPDLLPADWHQDLSIVASRNHDTELVLGGAQIVAALVSQADDDSSDQIADPETVLYGDPVLLGGPNVLASDLGTERSGADGRVGGDGGSILRSDDEDLSGSEAGAEAGYAGEDLRFDLWENVCVVLAGAYGGACYG